MNHSSNADNINNVDNADAAGNASDVDNVDIADAITASTASNADAAGNAGLPGKDVLEALKAEAKRFFEDSTGSHDWDHTLRVYALCTHIGEKEGADMLVLKVAALLHDIGRKYQDESNGKICHAQKGAELALELLSHFDIPNHQKDNILHCIRTHRFRGKDVPVSKEAKILFDADKLDSIGAVGIGRVFLFAGEIGAKLHDKDVDIHNTASYTRDDTAYREYLLKLRHIKDKMLTAEGKRLAEERHEFMTAFFDRLNDESSGIL